MSRLCAMYYWHDPLGILGALEIPFPSAAGQLKKEERGEKKKKKKHAVSMTYLQEGFFVNVDFDVLGHPEIIQKRDPQQIWWNEYCNKFFYFSLLLVCFHLNFLL